VRERFGGRLADAGGSWRPDSGEVIVVAEREKGDLDMTNTLVNYEVWVSRGGGP